MDIKINNNIKLTDLIEFNPQERLSKGTIAKKISMDNLIPFTRDISNYSLEPFNGGSKFRNGDTLFARITPCLENGKTSYVNILNNNNEIGFGSTEFIVMRAKQNISLPLFVYYLSTTKLIRNPAIKSMVGSSGRQRVQLTVLEELKIPYYSLPVQQHITDILGSIDDKIENNERIISCLAKLQTIEYQKLVLYGESIRLSEICKQISKRLKEKFATAYSVINSGELVKQNNLFNKQVHSEDMSNYKVIKKFDFAYNPSRINIGSIAMFEDDFGVVSPIYVAFSVNREYVYLLREFIKTKEFNNEIKKKASGSVRQAVNYDVFSECEMSIVNNDILLVFNSWYGFIMETIKKLQIENRKLNELKQLYLKKFFD